jgi:phosphohistidine phosphatase
MASPEPSPLRTLMLMRHAKSSWDNPAWTDHERPLNERGHRDAPRMGKLLGEQGLAPTLIVSSTATRARETAERVAEAIGYSEAILYEPRLYHAAPADWKDVLRALPDAHHRVLCVGHNPGLEELVTKWMGEHVEMPTAAVVVADVHLSQWSGYDRHHVSIAEIFKPREIDDRERA